MIKRKSRLFIGVRASAIDLISFRLHIREHVLCCIFTSCTAIFYTIWNDNVCHTRQYWIIFQYHDVQSVELSANTLCTVYIGHVLQWYLGFEHFCCTYHLGTRSPKSIPLQSSIMWNVFLFSTFVESDAAHILRSCLR